MKSKRAGALSDAVPAAMLPAGLREGRAARATVLWPASEPVPTAERPALSVVLVPRTEGSEVVPTGGATGAVDTPGTGPRAVHRGRHGGRRHARNCADLGLPIQPAGSAWTG